MNVESWYREIMSLKVPNLIHKDLTKILLIYYVFNNRLINKKIYYSDFSRYVYRFYIDNNKFAKSHPSIIFNNISNYGINDITPFIKQEIDDWENSFKNSCVDNNDNYILISIDNFDGKSYAFTKNIADMLFQKFTNTIFDYDESIQELTKISYYDLDFINKTKMLNRVREDMQYCVLCDELCTLKVINLSNDMNQISDLNNYVLVCEKHYELFKNQFYSIKENGYIKIIRDNELLNNAMHISRKILNDKRLDNLKKK